MKFFYTASDFSAGKLKNEDTIQHKVQNKKAPLAARFHLSL
jgi:hypothetical protein